MADRDKEEKNKRTIYYKLKLNEMKPSNKLEAYLKIIADGTRINDKVRVVERLNTGVQTLDTLCIAVGKTFNQISGRLSELNDEGVIKCIHNPTARFSIYQLVTDEEEAEIIRKARFEEKRQAWIKKGKEMGFL